MLTEDNATTFKRFHLSPKEEHILTTLALRSTVIGCLDLDMKERTADIISTNFFIFEPSVSVTGIDNENIEPDYDFIVPFKPQKSFKVKARIRSVTKFVPKPFFD